ncbi:MAG: serine/threonine protein kinase [Phycisphaerae bacterium]
MSTTLHEKIRDLLDEALTRPTEHRTRFVRDHCADHSTLRNEILSILPHYQVAAQMQVNKPKGAGMFRFPSTATIAHVHQRAITGISPDSFPAPPFCIDHYRVVELLGKGGMGLVYRALHPTRHESVAIKLVNPSKMTPEMRIRFSYEMEILRQLRHPGISAHMHSGFSPLRRKIGERFAVADTPYFVMEYVNGAPLTLYAKMMKCGLQDRIKLLVQICEAVEYAHRRGIIHRDLKPANILVGEDGLPKVLDFGVAKLENDVVNACGDKRGGFIGTPRYASPEQLEGVTDHLTARSDVYALGILAHELLTGQLPAQRGRRLEPNLKRIYRFAEEDALAVDLREVRYHLREAIGQTLQLEETRRFATAGEFGDALRKIGEDCFAIPRQSLINSVCDLLRRLFRRDGIKSTEESASRSALRAVFKTRVQLGVRSNKPAMAETHNATTELLDDQTLA